MISRLILVYKVHALQPEACGMIILSREQQRMTLQVRSVGELFQYE